jgi:co-chaperonin GroES (HSP10)
MIIPCGHRVLVRQEKYDEHDEVFKSARAAGIEIALDKNVRYQASIDHGTVISVGKTAWKDFGGDQWASTGDDVVFAKNAGKLVFDPEEKDLPEDKRTPYVLLNDEDIIAILRG